MPASRRASKWMRGCCGRRSIGCTCCGGSSAVSGFSVDGVEATPETMVERGPEELFREALAAVRARDGADGRRTKKLLVAFHFQFSNQAGWECDACRRVRPGTEAAMRVAGAR